MGKDVKITAYEGQFLFLASENFLLPKDLGEGHKYSNSDQSQANREVGRLHKLLRKLSPLAQGKRRLQLFGPTDNYDESEGENKSYKMKDLDFEVDLHLNSTTQSGIHWVLLLALHPAAPKPQSAGTQETVVWEIAEKLRIVRDLEKDIGLTDAKPRRWKTDDEYEEEEREEEGSKSKKVEGNGDGSPVPATDSDTEVLKK